MGPRTFDGCTPPAMIPLLDIPITQLVLVPITFSLVPVCSALATSRVTTESFLLLTLAVMLKNFLLFLITYGGVYYASTTFTFMKQVKYLKGLDTPYEMVCRERQRTLIACAIGSVYEIVFYYKSFDPNTVALPLNLPLLLVSVLWADFHFYAVHRLLHVEPLFTWIHSVHHQSYNPNVWSGLSFHPIESVLYYSAVVPYFFVWPGSVPFINAVCAKVIMDLSPIWGHVAVGGAVGGVYDHYLHHRLKDVNFGGTSLFDKVFGTFVASIEDHKKSQKK